MVAVSIIIPCYDEEEGIEALRQRLVETLPELEARGPVEVLLFDNGSRDRTLELMERHFGSDRRFKIHHHPTNANIGGALRVGLGLVSGDVIVTMDSDCTYDPKEIGALLDLLERGADVATASPYHPRGHVAGVPAWRLGLSRGLSLLYRATSPVALWTYTSMFRAYRRTVLESIEWRSDGFLSCAEIAVEAGLAGFKVAEHPTTLSLRRFGQSKIRIARVMRDHLGYLRRIVTEPRYRPRRKGARRVLST